jgi:hypothetical protein
MASIINLPFNFQPTTSPSTKTSSYTVPVGKYAKAVLSFYSFRNIAANSSGQFQNLVVNTAPYAITINGTSVITERQFSINLSSTPYRISSNYYSNSATINITGFYGYFQGYISGGDGTVFGTSPSQVGQGIFFAPFNTTVTSTANSTSTGSVSCPGVLTSYSIPESIEVWLKPGDVISATGGSWQAVVTEYTIPS